MLTSELINLLTEVLQLGEDHALTKDSQLLGVIPEFDSMAVVTVLTYIEEQYGIIIDDDEVDASIFETVSRLVDFVAERI